MWLMECVHEILVNYITELHHCLTEATGFGILKYMSLNQRVEYN